MEFNAAELGADRDEEDFFWTSPSTASVAAVVVVLLLDRLISEELEAFNGRCNSLAISCRMGLSGARGGLGGRVVVAIADDANGESSSTATTFDAAVVELVLLSKLFSAVAMGRSIEVSMLSLPWMVWWGAPAEDVAEVDRLGGGAVIVFTTSVSTEVVRVEVVFDDDDGDNAREVLLW